MKHIEVFKPTRKKLPHQGCDLAGSHLVLFFSEDIILETQDFMRCNFLFIALNLKFS